jgi:uncharacterized protein YigA (DUF484 family)
MLRFLGMVLLLSLVFGLGYYTGQRPVGELKQTAVDLSRKLASMSRSAMENTGAIERKLRWQQGLLDAKSKVVQAKAEVLDHNFGNAAKELGEALEYLDKSAGATEEKDQRNSLQPIREKVRSMRADLAAGKNVGKNRMDEIQKELDVLGNR